MKKIKERNKQFWKDQRGAGVVEMLLILVVLIGLIIIFRAQIFALVQGIFESIQRQAGTLY